MLLFAVAGAGSALADEGFTGAMFVDPSYHTFASGFAWGILQHELSIIGDDGKERPDQARYRKCFIGGTFDSESFYFAVDRFIKAHPETLLQNAIAPTLNAMNEICPAPTN